MVKTVLFDMGGTLEDIYVDAASERAAMLKLDAMLRSWGMHTQVDLPELKQRVDAGWARYGVYRDAHNVELKPVEIW